MKRRVFLGGPLHGQSRLLPEGALRFETFVASDRLPRPCARYCLYRFGIGGKVVDFMVFKRLGYWRAKAALRRMMEGIGA